MKGSKRLKPVAKFARQRERDAARQLGSDLRQAELEQKQLDDLIAYREQYEANFQAAGKQGLNAVQLRDYQLFLKRLDTAIEQQQQKLNNSRDHCEQSKSEWQDRHGNSKIIDKVVENRKQAEDQTLERQEQREQDDRPRNPEQSDYPDS